MLLGLSAESIRVYPCKYVDIQWRKSQGTWQRHDSEISRELKLSNLLSHTATVVPRFDPTVLCTM